MCLGLAHLSGALVDRQHAGHALPPDCGKGHWRPDHQRESVSSRRTPAVDRRAAVARVLRDVQIPTESGHGFRFKSGQCSDHKPATLPT